MYLFLMVICKGHLLFKIKISRVCCEDLTKKWHLDGLSTRCKDVRSEALKTTICLSRGKTFKKFFHCHSTPLLHPVKR